MLAINTAFLTANLALSTKDGDFFEELDAKSKHSENVLNTIDKLCGRAKIDINDIVTFAMVVGPGSFTGLRISASICQALASVNPNLKFVSLTSLELMAYIIVKNNLAQDNFVCVLNALSDLFFVCKFDKNGIKLSEPEMIDRPTLEKIREKKFALAGDLPNFDFESVELTSQALLELANAKVAKNDFAKREEMLPLYLRLSQAEDNLLKKNKKD